MLRRLELRTERRLAALPAPRMELAGVCILVLLAILEVTRVIPGQFENPLAGSILIVVGAVARRLRRRRRRKRRHDPSTVGA